VKATAGESLQCCSSCNKVYHRTSKCIGSLYPVSASNSEWARPKCPTEAQRST
jgi:hypothetical protein